jgi:hypothetical protein
MRLKFNLGLDTSSLKSFSEKCTFLGHKLGPEVIGKRSDLSVLPFKLFQRTQMLPKFDLGSVHHF